MNTLAIASGVAGSALAAVAAAVYAWATGRRLQHAASSGQMAADHVVVDVTVHEPPELEVPSGYVTSESPANSTVGLPHTTRI